jgi:hypothetical protein
VALPGGLPHSLQGAGPDGAEFVLAFDDGAQSEIPGSDSQQVRIPRRPAIGRLDLDVGGPPKPSGQVPAAVAEQAQGAGQDDQADERGVQEQGDGDAESHLLEHDELSAGEAAEHGDDDEGGTGGRPARATAGAEVSTSGGPAHYEIRVEGILDSRWSAWFGGLHIEGDDTQTVITGSLAEQSALHGLLTKIRDPGSA